MKNLLKIHEECRIIKEQTLGKQHPSYATTLVNIGSCLYEQRKYKDALVWFMEAKEILKNTVGTPHPSYLTVVEWLRSIECK